MDRIEKRQCKTEEILIDMWYNQKATMTREEREKASDLKASDTNYTKLISGRLP
jgi:hypothetical protein